MSKGRQIQIPRPEIIQLFQKGSERSTSLSTPYTKPSPLILCTTTNIDVSGWAAPRSDVRQLCAIPPRHYVRARKTHQHRPTPTQNLSPPPRVHGNRQANLSTRRRCVGTTTSCSTIQTTRTSNSAGPTFVNINVAPSFSALAVQNRAQPPVNEQMVCLPYVRVVVFTEHASRGPRRVYQRPSNPSTPCLRQNSVGTSYAMKQTGPHVNLRAHIVYFSKNPQARHASATLNCQ